MKIYNWITSLRVLATFSVIFLHTSAEILYQYGKTSNANWWIGNIYDSSVRFCVPIFLMISGALILSKDYKNITEYLKKRVLRIIFPFLFWSIVYIFINNFLYFYKENLTFIDILKFTLIKLKIGASFHLWYIYMIIGLYLFFPIIKSWLSRANDNEIKYFIGIWLITICIKLPIINTFIPNIEITYFSGYIGFPILGYYLSKKKLNLKRKKVIYIILIVIGLLITIFGTYFATKYKGTFYEGFYDYLTPNVLFISIGVFLFFKDFVTVNSKIIIFFNKYSYGTYLVHILTIIVLQKAGVSYALINPMLGIPITSITCFIISTLIIWGVNNLPFGKYISG
ncbi:acyltransferase family protein [Flavobacterium oreochromis]|uniref:Acyltransferase family protein n=1 Tax=Flavobacterium oreochromis TaxID=2906078 RepID=A0ABW8P5X6_9FLAO|nr:acyltransferase family protein [Flavobacterium oreochromis]OWP74226.1 hypothetical protein BWG23_14585 [Flavobacterium oreochromis]